MAKKGKPRLADDIRASLHEAIDHAAGQRTKVVVHRIVPRAADAARREPFGAARTLIEVIKTEPKAVRRALAKSNPAA